jgi:hypothetical protein
MANHGRALKTPPHSQGGADEGGASGTMSKVKCAAIQGKVCNDPRQSAQRPKAKCATMYKANCATIQSKVRNDVQGKVRSGA